MVALVLCVVLGQAADAPYRVSDRPVQSMTRRELKLEYAKLDEARPGIGLPITLMSVGGGLVAWSSIYLLGRTGAVGGVFPPGDISGYLYVTLIVIGAGMILPGIWLLWNRREERSVMGDRMDEINAQLDKMDRERDRRRELPPEQPQSPRQSAEPYQL